ncbi:FAD-linked sulfhydryl oxidase ERV1 [Plasmodium gonderi]|uniref:Sulfhydryl oxidase n=1 Tax=Plasmodium gonderi TaxID=77519 RepID=A0A1Y1JCY6_PLAGO|nr:FAD-linked sulfhydryl oxidase ERV1 [Plasmodium gonderi]GAW79077.1 FAD-linked sulfhydryl oxidase ERV1 [Plasmodium gonderi]
MAQKNIDVEKCYEQSCKERGEKLRFYENINEKNVKIYPPDREEIGRASWLILHTISANYPEKPTDEDKKKHTNFFYAFANLYPCHICKLDLFDNLKNYQMTCQNRNDFSSFIYNLHNKVNEDIGKPLFPCSNIQEVINLYKTAE